MDVFQLFERCGDIGLLLFQFLDEGVRTLGDKDNLLRAAFAPAAIEIEELPDLGERKADRLRPKNELQPCSFPPRIDAAAVELAAA